MTPTRRALLAAGVATIAVSMVLSIAPVIAANGNGNSGNAGNGGGNAGTIKIYDATTGLETAESDNDPHVCAFWVAFHAPDPFEAGTWQLLSWAPTGDGSVVASGTYDTTGDGLDATATLSPDPGHFRFEWGAVGTNNSKNKTLWVDETCGEDETPPGEDETPPGEDETPPSEDETPPSEDETPPGEDETPSLQDETPPGEDETPSLQDETLPSQNQVPPSQDQTPPSQDQQGESGILAGNSNPSVVENSAPEGAVATGDAATTLPDTSIPLGSSGVLAAMGLLLIVAAHAGTRRRPLRG